MSRKQGVTVDCSQCNCSTDIEYLICTSCVDDIKKELQEKESELMDKDVEIYKLVEKLAEIDSRYKYYLDLVQGCTTCGAKCAADNM